MGEITYTPLTWDDLVNDASLQNLPYKIELRDGEIVMSPAGKTHAKLQAGIAVELSRRGDGVVMTEVAIRTDRGVFVADVAWVSNDRWSQYPDDGPLPFAPEICVEIQSPSNTSSALAAKAQAYIAAGAREVWIVQLDGSRTLTTP